MNTAKTWRELVDSTNALSFEPHDVQRREAAKALQEIEVLRSDDDANVISIPECNVHCKLDSFTLVGRSQCLDLGLLLPSLGTQSTQTFVLEKSIATSPYLLYSNFKLDPMNFGSLKYLSGILKKAHVYHMNLGRYGSKKVFLVFEKTYESNMRPPRGDELVHKEIIEFFQKRVFPDAISRHERLIH